MMASPRLSLLREQITDAALGALDLLAAALFLAIWFSFFAIALGLAEHLRPTVSAGCLIALVGCAFWLARRRERA